MRDTRDVKATGLQGDTVAEIIEILDDDSDVFGDRAHNTTIQDTGGPRWVGPVAAVALLALFGYGVATSASSGAPKAAPAPSTTVHTPTTTLPAPTTTADRPPAVPYYDADPPREFSIQFADFHEVGGRILQPRHLPVVGHAEFHGGSGSWFSVEIVFAGSSSTYAVDAYRVQAGEQSIAISHMPTGQSVAQFSVNRSVAVTLTSFGRSDEDLVRLAQSVTVEGLEIKLIRSGGDPRLPIDHHGASLARGARDPDRVDLLRIQERRQRRDRADGRSSAAAGQGGATLDRQIALRFFLDQPSTFEVDGHVAVAGASDRPTGPGAGHLDRR